MALVEVLMPKMGESITDATIIKWHKKEGDKISADEILLEVATDKVDSEVPCPYEGVIHKILFTEDTLVDIGEPIAIINSEGVEQQLAPIVGFNEGKMPSSDNGRSSNYISKKVSNSKKKKSDTKSSTFLSPLVKRIAVTEGISTDEIAALSGSGSGGRVTKSDIVSYINTKRNNEARGINHPELGPSKRSSTKNIELQGSAISLNEGDQIVEMDRMRMLIAKHMTESQKTSAHVTSFAEADVTKMVQWRIKVKEDFAHKFKNKLTFTPLITEVVSRTLKEYPRLNASLQGDKIIVKKNINIGVATALPGGNLIVPVLKNADQLSLAELAERTNDLAERARTNNLKGDEIKGGTFTLTNIGTFDSLMGTPIINQPQLGILATGAIKKRPVVIENNGKDEIAIRHIMYLSLSYDHRVIDGFLGGTFLQAIVKNLENFDLNRVI